MLGNIRKVIVVGGGPAGASCALAMRLRGVREVLVLDRSDGARDKVCAGGLSPRAVKVLDRLGLLSDLVPKASVVRGARLVAPNGKDYVSSVGVTAYVMRRAAFDGHLLGEAERAGATVERGVAVDRLVREGGLAVAAGDRMLEADAVVLAGGAHCRLDEDPRPRLRLDGVLARYEGVDVDPTMLQLAFDRRLLPNYAWLFPEPGGTVNVGLCCRHGTAGRPLPLLLEELADEHFPELRGATRLGRIKGHPIVYSTAARALVDGRVLRVGEAGRLTDGFTGEGIWHALRSGVEAAEALAVGEPRRYERRAKLVFDPVLRGSSLLSRVAGSPLMPSLLSMATDNPLAPLVGRVLGGLGR